MKKILVVIVLLFLTSCQPTTSDYKTIDIETSNGVKIEYLGWNFYRLTDIENNKICYSKDGIWCGDLEK